VWQSRGAPWGPGAVWSRRGTGCPFSGSLGPAVWSRRCMSSAPPACCCAGLPPQRLACGDLRPIRRGAVLREYVEMRVETFARAATPEACTRNAFTAQRSTVLGSCRRAAARRRRRSSEPWRVISGCVHQACRFSYKQRSSMEACGRCVVAESAARCLCRQYVACLGTTCVNLSMSIALGVQITDDGTRD